MAETFPSGSLFKNILAEKGRRLSLTATVNGRAERFSTPYGPAVL